MLAYTQSAWASFWRLGRSSVVLAVVGQLVHADAAGFYYAISISAVYPDGRGALLVQTCIMSCEIRLKGFYRGQIKVGDQQRLKVFLHFEIASSCNKCIANFFILSPRKMVSLELWPRNPSY